MLKKTIFIVVSIFVLINILLGLTGISSVLLTLSMYLAGWFVFSKILGIIIRDPAKNNNFQLLFITLVITLFVSEITLKYAVKSHLTYAEQNSKFFYNSMYKRYLYDNFRRKYFLKQKDIQLPTYPPNSLKKLIKPEFTYDHSYNSLGLRDIEPRPDTGLYTIIGLGDSFTEGYGSPQDSTWLKLLEANLRAQIPGKKLQTINGGISNTDPFSELLILERLLLKYHPDMVIVAINNSDIDDVMIRGGTERFANEKVTYKSGPWWEFFYSFSYIFRAFIHNICGYNYFLIPEKNFESQKTVAIDLIKNCVLTNYKNLALKKHFQLVVVLQPMQNELEKNKFSLAPLTGILSKDHSMLTVNLFDEYRSAQKTNNFIFKDLYWEKDLHHNSKGYKLWADVLSKKVLPLIK